MISGIRKRSKQTKEPTTLNKQLPKAHDHIR
jgi:hypothetical protein